MNHDPNHNVYLVEQPVLDRMAGIASALQGGDDRQRDLGHRLWLAIKDIQFLKLTDEEVKLLGGR